MELIKMFKRIKNNLKYTQNAVCFAVGKIVRSLSKTFDNNLISLVASLTALDSAFNDLYDAKIKKQKDHNNIFWHYARNWQTRRLILRQELQNGTYLLGPITNYTIPTGIGAETTEVSVWDDESLIVLKVLKNVLEPYLKSKMDLTAASHLKDHGGLKASVNKANKLSQHNKFIMKTDIAKFYASINHNKLGDILADYISDKRVLNLIMQYCNRCEIKNAAHYLVNTRSIPRGCPLSPLMGAVYLLPLDDFAKKNKLDYVRYMDDFIFFAKTRNKLRGIVKKVHKIIADLRLWLAPDKTYIGSLKKGFSFLGYKILGETLSISTTSLRRLRANINRLYEQQASNARLGRYLEKWLSWAKGGVNNFINPIKINITPNPSTRMQVHVSDDMCHVFW
jgi:RNA-directed DNA polymerase